MQFNYLFTLNNAHLRPNSYNFGMQALWRKQVLQWNLQNMWS